MSRPLRILIVEDEMMIALMIEDMLIEMGHEVVGLAMRLPQAMEIARNAEIDLAILDVNLDGQRSFPVAEVLQERGVAFFFASGYGSAGIEPPFADRLIIKKPFVQNELSSAIEAMSG
jgi:DNA-binding response OmpR family regulator